MKLRYCLAAVFAAHVTTVVQATELPAVSAFDPTGADVVLLGEVHDNSWQHENQTAAVAAIAPTALVFEMLDAGQAAVANASDRSDMAALAEALDWKHSSWPDFGMYHPIFLAAPEAPIYGAAIPREALMSAMSEGAASVFGEEAEEFGLGPLPEDVWAAREAFQLEAHCNALPAEMLGGMVEAQRLRDASFSATTLEALRDTGGPVVVITGNGHARRDWGMPVYLAAAAPDVSVRTLAQFELSAPEGDIPHDFWLVTQQAEREDPCAVFAKRATDN